MFAVVLQSARSVFELSLDFRKFIVKLVDQVCKSLYFSAFGQFLHISQIPGVKNVPSPASCGSP